MNSKDYWAKREAEALNHYITDEAEYDRQIKQIYQDMLDSCQTQINDFYGRYAAKEGITLAEAKKRVSKLDIEKYERKAKRYVKDKDFSDKANEEMRLYNLTMKVNRLEMLKANIGLELIAGHNELEKFMGDILKGRTEEELKRQAGILGKTIRNNAQLAHTIPNASFHHANFSDRIWMYHDLMKADLAKMLKTGLVQGKNPRVLARELEKYVMGDGKGGAKYNAERLMRTELARVQTEAQKQSFERNGFEKYIFIVNGGCCAICEAAKNKDIGYGKGVYLVKDMMPGENASPMHPHCRCSTAAYEDSDEYEAWLDYLDKGGTTEEWNKLKEFDTVPKLNAEKEKWLKEHDYDIYGDTLSEMEKGFWEEAADGSMEAEAAWIEAINKKIGSFLSGKGLVNFGKSDIIKSNKYGFKYIKGKHTPEQDAKASNPNYSKGREYKINCQRCCPTYEMRRRGYDVEALPYSKSSDAAYKNWQNIFENAKWLNVGLNRGSQTMNKIVKNMENWGNGARSEIYVVWKNSSSAHVFMCENINGVVRFIDPQTGNDDVSSYFTQIKPTRTMMCRLDELEPTDLIKECCK